MSLDVSVVIVSHNSEGDLALCVDSLLAHTGDLELELTVADSGSSDATGTVAAGLPVNFLSGPNEGFGSAVNRAAERLEPSRYMLLVNPDARIVSGSLADLLARCDRLPGSGIFGTKQIDERGARTNSMRRFPTPARSWAEASKIRSLRDRGERCMLPQPYERMTDCDWVMGAFMLIRTSLFRELRGFDERFFLYSEEVDLCRRAALAGVRVTYVPAMTVRHRDINRRLPDPRSYLLARSQLIYARKWQSHPGRALVRAALLAGYGRSAIDPRRPWPLRSDSRSRLRAVLGMRPLDASMSERATGA